jgi:hypothetical protein
VNSTGFLNEIQMELIRMYLPVKEVKSVTVSGREIHVFLEPEYRNSILKIAEISHEVKEKKGITRVRYFVEVEF